MLLVSRCFRGDSPSAKRRKLWRRGAVDLRFGRSRQMGGEVGGLFSSLSKRVGIVDVGVRPERHLRAASISARRSFRASIERRPGRVKRILVLCIYNNTEKLHIKRPGGLKAKPNQNEFKESISFLSNRVSLCSAHRTKLEVSVRYLKVVTTQNRLHNNLEYLPYSYLSLLI